MLYDVGSTSRHDSRDLVMLFDQTFVGSHRTCLCGGAEEPLYAPAGRPGELHRIFFTRDYFASALHEVAHWCVAGPARRQREDYGYWYAPDGRTDDQQAEFERVEVRPQALERLFARAADFGFRPSADNLAAGLGPSEAFRRAIHEQTLTFCERGVNERVSAFLAALIDHYGTAISLSEFLRPQRFGWSELA